MLEEALNVGINLSVRNASSCISQHSRSIRLVMLSNSLHSLSWLEEATDGAWFALGPQLSPFFKVEDVSARCDYQLF